MTGSGGRDIVVTIPAARLAAVEAEEREVAVRQRRGETCWQYFWEMGRLPKDRIRRAYFVWDGAVRAWHDVVGSVPAEGGGLALYAGRERDMSRAALYLHPEIHAIEPIPMASFRGFRYFDEKEARRRVAA